MYASRETVKKTHDLGKELKALLKAEGLKVEDHHFIDSKCNVGHVSIYIDYRKSSKGYSHDLVVKWEYGGYPSTKKWTRCEKNGVEWKLPKDVVKRTKKIVAEAEEEKAARDAKHAEESKRRKAADRRKEASAELVEALREDLGLPKRSYKLTFIQYNGACISDTADATKVKFEFKGAVTPEKAKRLLEVLAED